MAPGDDQSMAYRILGPLEVRVDESHWAPVTGANAVLLAVLLANAGKLVRHEQVARALWPDPPATADVQRHKRISELRGLLERIGRGDRLVSERNLGYRLVVDHGELDSHEFHRLTVEADQSDAAGDPALGYAHRRAALALWRDRQALTGLDHPLLAEVTEALRRRRLRVAEALFARALVEREHELILAAAPDLVAPDPTGERLWAAWIIALYRTERRAQAIEVGERFDQLTHTAANPLRDLCYAVGRGDTSAVEAHARRLAPGAGRDLLPLPADLTDLTGRRGQVERACQILSATRSTAAGPLVLTGPPGAGKTTLAVHIAHQLAPAFPDGVWFLEVGTAPMVSGPTRESHRSGQPTDLTAEPLARLLRALGVAAEQIPADRAGRIDAYRQRSAGRRMLLVLDDAPDVASLRDLLPTGAGKAALVTSQDQLTDLPDAHRIPLAELDPAEATALFRRIAEQGGADLTSERPADLAEVVEACGRLPLAIRVAGTLYGAYRHVTAAELASIISQDLDTLVIDELSVPAAIATSYRRLDGLAQTLLRRLALLELPEIPVWLAATVFAATPAVAEQILDRLVARSLVSAPAPGRYRLHDLIRRYARRQAERHEEWTDVVARGYGALLGLAEAAHRGIFDGDFEIVYGEAPRWELPLDDRDRLLSDPIAWFDQERRNLRAAVAHAARLGMANRTFAALSWQLAIASHEYHAQRGWSDDWFDTHTAALAACRSVGDSRGEAVMVVSLAQPTLVNTGRSGLPGPAELAAAAAWFSSTADRAGEAFARRTLGSAHRRVGDFVAAEQQLTAARSGYRECGDRFGEWQAIRLLGQSCLDSGDPTRAREYLNEALELAGKLGHPRALPQTRFWLGRAELGRGDLVEAARCFHQALAAAEQAGDSTGIAYCRHGLGEVALRDARPAAAAQLFDEAGRAAALAGEGLLAGWIQLSRAELHRRRNEPEAARRCLREAATRFGQTSAAWQRDHALRLLRDVARPD